MEGDAQNKFRYPKSLVLTVHSLPVSPAEQAATLKAFPDLLYIKSEKRRLGLTELRLSPILPPPFPFL